MDYLCPSMESEECIIGKYRGQHPGPLFVCIGGMHGNEPAGFKAIELVLKMLEVEPITNPDFEFYGQFLGILGNPQAFIRGVRFIDQDMNRSWLNPAVLNNDFENAHAEEKAILEILEILNQEIADNQPNRLIILDLHTTSSSGGIFSIVNDEEYSLRLARGMLAPVIHGLTHELHGTSLSYFTGNRYPIPTTSVVFEAGNHTEHLSVNRAIAAIICCLRTAHCVNTQDVENQHIKILQDYSRDLPDQAYFVHRHQIRSGDQFTMLPNYKNFQPIQQGELLAHDINGPIYAPSDGMILLPLYQKQGEDGFFIVKEKVSPYENLHTARHRSNI